MNKYKRFFAISSIFLFVNTLNAATSFTGFAGGKINYSADTTKADTTTSTPSSTSIKEDEEGAEKYNPSLKLQAFFAGQFNFSQNLWSHMEFSIDTNNLISTSLFEATPSLFQIDEISIIGRTIFPTSANYLSAYMGTYDSIGSDVFLRRYFGCEPIASKISESWLGLDGSILYPHFGIGASDVVKLYDKPWAFGGYMYINHEDAKYFVFNTDLRAACVYRFFTCDLACGLGAPLADKYQGEDVIIAIDKLYWHAGTTMLVGNNYTTSLFLQAGIFNASFTAKKSGMFVGANDIYLLVEPRFFVGNNHLNITAFSLPQKTVDKFMFVDDTLGIDLNMYTESISFGTQIATIGTHISGSFTNKSFLDLKDIKNITSEGMNVNLTPYISTTFLNGELHAQAKVKFMELIKGTWYNAFSADIGYSCKL